MMNASRPDILITGFGPFPGVMRNPTATLAPMVAGRLKASGVDARALLLPTSYARGLPLLAHELKRIRPRAVLMLGLAAKSRFIRIEAFARIDASPTSPDAGGAMPERRAGSAMPLAATAALEPALAAMRKGGLRARLSPSAGRYLCNAAYAVALGMMPRGVPVLFVHIPWPRGWRGVRPASTVANWRPGMGALERALAQAAREALLRRARRRAQSRPAIAVQ
jgi:pyroglutamyl-peptidase